jgi:hypothetical protein
MTDQLSAVGTTTRQLQYAAPNAVFVWHMGDTRYARRLAAFLGRSDLRIQGRQWISCEACWRGHQFPDVILDHQISPTELERSHVENLRACVRPRPQDGFLDPLRFATASLLASDAWYGRHGPLRTIDEALEVGIRSYLTPIPLHDDT